jgi:hypothetical protein
MLIAKLKILLTAHSYIKGCFNMMHKVAMSPSLLRSDSGLVF